MASFQGIKLYLTELGMTTAIDNDRFKRLSAKSHNFTSKKPTFLVGLYNRIPKKRPHFRAFEDYIEILHGKFARTIFIHELSSIRKRKSERSERVEFPDMYQRVNKYRTKHFPCCSEFIS